MKTSYIKNYLFVLICSSFCPVVLTNPSIDHIPVFYKIFKINPINSFLEFGLGDSTKFFLDRCEFVMSVEFSSNKNAQQVDDLFNLCINRYKNYQNWHIYLYECKKAINQAENLIYQNIDPKNAKIDYITEINQLIKHIFSHSEFDIAFVDSSIHLRGELVNALFGKVKIIVAHDTNALVHTHNVDYGWHKIKPPVNYETIVFKHGSGTTVWIDKQLHTLINNLKK